MLTPATATAGSAGSVASRADTLALSIGSKLTVSTLMVSCVLVICAGASSMLSSLHKMDADIKIVNEQLAVTNKANDILNNTLQSLPPMSDHLKAVNVTIASTKVEVKKSATSLNGLASATTKMNQSLGSISSDTAAMSQSLKNVDRGAGQLQGTVDQLDVSMDPLVTSQHETLVQARMLPKGIYAMNDRLAYVIRQLNYIAQPPANTPNGFTVALELPKGTLPPIPGLKAEAQPAVVFTRGVWPVYTGP